MTAEEMRFTAALAIYRDITANLFTLHQRHPASNIPPVVPFAVKYAVQQADMLMAELGKAELGKAE